MQIFWHNTNSRLREAYSEDRLAKELRKNQLDTETLIYKGKIYLP